MARHPGPAWALPPIPAVSLQMGLLSLQGTLPWGRGGEHGRGPSWESQSQALLEVEVCRKRARRVTGHIPVQAVLSLPRGI